MGHLEALRELRRRQGIRVANASRGKREAELDLWGQLDDRVRIEEARQEMGAQALLEGVA